MNRHHLTFLAVLSAAALFAGYGARRLTEPRLPSATAVTPAASAREIAPATAAPMLSPSHSTDTLESLAAPDDAHLYARLALWLVDASEPDIAAFWSRYSKNDELAYDIVELVFLHWTRLDPQHAIVGAGSDYEELAWEAWGRNDPQAALAAAIVAGPGSLKTVALAIGHFQPDWLRIHFDEIPEVARLAAVGEMSDCEGGKNLLANLKLLKREGLAVGPELIKALTREDPYAAIEWAKRHTSSNDPFRENGGALPTVIQTLAAESPDELARIAERTPSGTARLEMEAALFANLVKTDPAAALEQAKATTVPRTAAEHYATIGQALVRTDPAQALQLAKDLFTACPDALNLSTPIQYSDGNSVEESLDIPGVSDFMVALMVRQPQQVMEMATALWPDSEEGFASFLARQWIEQDFGGYATWLNQQASPAVRQGGAELIVSRLQNMENYPEAAEWASSLPPEDSFDPISDVLGDWKKQNPAAAALWLKDANLPPDRKARLQPFLDRP